MGKKSTLSAEQRAQIVLRLLSKEEPAVQIARRAGIAEQTLYRWRETSFSVGVSRGGEQSEQAKKIERLKGEAKTPCTYRHGP